MHAHQGANSSLLECQSGYPRKCDSMLWSGQRYCSEQHADLDQARLLHRTPAALRYFLSVLLPKSPSGTEISRCSRRRSGLLAVQKPTARLLSGLSGRHSVLAGVQLHNGLFIERRRGDGGVLQLTWPCQHDNVQPSADAASWRRRTAHAWSESPLAYLHASPPCPVARVPFSSSCAVSGSETR